MMSEIIRFLILSYEPVEIAVLIGRPFHGIRDIRVISLSENLKAIEAQEFNPLFSCST